MPTLRSSPLLLLTVLSACFGYKSDLNGAEAVDDTGGYGGADDSADSSSDGDWAGEDSAPPEEEDDFLRLAPAATDAYVFVANPARNTVTRIQVPGLQVDTREVGRNPVAVSTAADFMHAVTFNAASDDVSIIDAPSFEVTNVAVRENYNTLSMSPDGRWVMCWYDEDIGPVDTSGGVQSFNEVSFVNVETGVHTGMVVGLNPHGVRWTPDGRMALVVADSALAVVDLTAEPLSAAPPLIEIDEDPLSAPPAEEVELTPDGQYAYVRQFGASDILVADIENLVFDRIPVGDNPTDLDLSPGGDALAVVSRGSHELWVFDSDAPFEPPAVLPFSQDYAYGSVLYAGDGAQAVLYTNAALTNHLAIWDTSTGTITDRTLVKPVDTIGVSPDGRTLLIFHTRENQEGLDPTSSFYNEYALTLQSLESLSRFIGMILPNPAKGYSTSEDGRYGYFIMEGQETLEVLNFTDLLYTSVKLKSQPVYIGVLPGTDLAYVSQEHELGRISFYDPGSGALDTVTGFELNSEIDHEEQ